jgi:hypothetical protein
MHLFTTLLSWNALVFLWRMALTKSSHPRQIEEESGAGVPNFPKGIDHEDDTTNQGSGDARATKLPILGPDGDGDNEIPSPSSYLNLDQYENEEDEGNAEHEGDVNEEDEGNAE